MIKIGVSSVRALTTLFLFVALSVNDAYGLYVEEAPESDIPSADNIGPVDASPEIPVITFSKVKGAPVIDGVLDDPIWAEAQIFSIDYELYPKRYGKASVETYVYALLTDTHTFFAFDARDPDPSQIRTAFRNRDAVKEDDYVSLVVDPTGTGSKKYEFRVNPSGVLTDVLQNTVADRYYYDWDSNWIAEAQVTDSGYIVEIAIPHQSIRLPKHEDDTDQMLLLMFKRSYPRSTDKTLGSMMLVKRAKEQELADARAPLADSEAMSAAEKVEYEKRVQQQEEDMGASAQIASKRDLYGVQNVEVTPHYILHKDDERDPGDPEFEQSSNYDINEFGVDAKVRFGTNKTLGLTVNPNFTEVESDIARDSINNPFNPFKPEKRSFFQSGSPVYNTLLPMVYTRNIRFPEWGANYIQNTRNSTTGLFYVEDAETEFVMPDNLGSDTMNVAIESNASAFRYEQSFGKKSLGVLGTLRQGQDNYHNYVGGVDGLWDLSIDDKLRFQLMYSDTQYNEAFADDLCESGDCTRDPIPDFCPLGNCGTNAYVQRADYERKLTGHAFRFNYKHDGPNGLYWLNYYDVHRDFRGDLGFQKQVDYRSVNLAYGQKWYLRVPNDDGESRIRAYGVFTETRSQANEDIETAYALYGEFRGWKQTVFRFGPTWKSRAVNRINQNSLELGDNAPLFDEHYWLWYYEISPWSQWTFNFDGKYGEQADSDNLRLGDLREFKPRVRYQLGHIEIDAKATHRIFDVEEGQLYKEEFYTLGVTYRSSKIFSHRLLWLYDITERNLAIWLGSETAKETSNSVEYTAIYQPSSALRILSGFKFEDELDSDVDDKRYLTNRELYVKLEYTFSKGFD
ncbi:hypothetical protein A3765_08770 [Oleiphilus sp. HI0130]|nr:hypothetical protein A3765_08770 [Oleiphilus sp. HI0130]